MSVRRAAATTSDVGQVEQAVSLIVRWATRNDVQQETMRRARCDLPRGHVWLLARVELCGPARLSDLAVALGVDNSTLTPQAKRLERDGLIVRSADPRDHRAALLRVTRAGRGLLARLRRSRRAILSDLLADWPANERAQVAKQLTRLAQALDHIHEANPTGR